MNTENTTPARTYRRDSYRGAPLIVLPMGESRDFSFGKTKAQAIVRYASAVREFAATGSYPDPKIPGVSADEYRGNPLLVVETVVPGAEPKYRAPGGASVFTSLSRPFSFGRAKAQAIVAHFTEIETFAAEIDAAPAAPFHPAAHLAPRFEALREMRSLAARIRDLAREARVSGVNLHEIDVATGSVDAIVGATENDLARERDGILYRTNEAEIRREDRAEIAKTRAAKATPQVESLPGMAPLGVSAPAAERLEDLAKVAGWQRTGSDGKPAADLIPPADETGAQPISLRIPAHLSAADPRE